MRGFLWFIGFLVVTFLLGNYSKWSVDRQLAVLCKKDAGLTVYEQVKLPANRFDKDGHLIPLTPYRAGVNTELSMFGPDYRIAYQSDVLVEGTPSDFFSRARLLRSVTQVVRVIDKKLLAELIDYGRTGGGIAEIHPSSNSCVEAINIDIYKSTFVKEN
jgi:hypothetical protein